MTDQGGLSIPIYLSGPMPRTTWCAVCVMLFSGQISSEPEMQKYAMELTEAAIEAGASFVSIDLPERDDCQLLPAVTVAPSWLYRIPDWAGMLDIDGEPQSWRYPELPVCWTHVAGIPPKGMRSEQSPQQGQPSRLIAGKSYRPIRER